MGKALAEEAVRAGYAVEFVTGPVAEQNLPSLEPLTVHAVTSAEEMLATAQPLFALADIIIFAAAVADYAPAQTLTEKITKSTEELVLRLRPTPDIAQTLCAEKKAHQMAMGFALQTSDGEKNARRKLASKNLDGIVLNTPATLGAENGTFCLFEMKSERVSDWGYISKTQCAKKIFEFIKS